MSPDWSKALTRVAPLLVRVEVPEYDGGTRIGTGITEGDATVIVLGLLVARVAMGEVWVHADRLYAAEVNVWGRDLASALIDVPNLRAGRCEPRSSTDLGPNEPMIAVAAIGEGFASIPGSLHAVLPHGIPGERWRKSLLLCSFEKDPLDNGVAFDREGRFLGFVAHGSLDGEHTIVIPAEHVIEQG
jgi:hypothetical protein